MKALDGEVRALERRSRVRHAPMPMHETSYVPGIGRITARALAATVPDPQGSARRAGLRLGSGHTPAHGTGGKNRSGDLQARHRNLGSRIIGATAQLRHARRRGAKDPWQRELMDAGQRRS